MTDDFKPVPTPEHASDSLIAALHDIAAGLNPEVIFCDKPRGRAFDLRYEYTSFAPVKQRWSCVDANTYDGAPDAEPPCTFIGRGRTEAEARADLLEQFSDQDAQDNPKPVPRAPCVIHSSPFEPPEYAAPERDTADDGEYDE
jgi:hypothetical protein